MKIVKVKIRPDQIEYLWKCLKFDRKNNKPPALISVTIEAELQESD